jgi:SAM-dependent methyltransferase
LADVRPPAHPAPDFGPLAESYDRLRPGDDNWWEILDLLVAEGKLDGRRVLDVGCGTGRVAAALAERGARVWAIDPSPEMLARARENAGPRVGFKQARAEALPFKDGWFERVVLRLVTHLVDRERAFREIYRVLVPSGVAVLATFDPEHLEGFWLAQLFPAVLEIDRRRFRPADELAEELRTAGFGDVHTRTVWQQASISRAEALERVRGRYISTLRLIGDDDFAAGLERAEQELPARIDYRPVWNIVTAERATDFAARRRFG